MNRDYSYIDNDEALARYCAALSEASCCVIDTEFIRESTYYAELALIQVGSGDQFACIDPLAITDFKPFAELLVRPDLVKVFHSSSQDLEILYQKFAAVPSPVFDTQLAAAVLGYNHQISYADLVQQLCGVTLEKKHTRANWKRRPLSEDELDYAMDDVRYLLSIYEQLRDQLQVSRRSSWLERDLRDITDPEKYRVNMEQLWKRLKGVQKLKGEKLQIASDLCRWREQQAQRCNRPRRWILKDDTIIEIARHKPDSIESLSRIRELGDKTIQRNGDQLLSIVAQAQSVDAQHWPRPDKVESLSKHQLALGDCLMALCRVFAEQNQIALATLVTRKDIDNLILNQKSSRLTQGWRFTMAGEKLLEFIHGQSAISVEDDHLKLESR
ncbi:MAG: ribonuclease D [Gammaproteobacteria bacterium]|nr:ribonuclease D [Gammaproteobacteria bacterium]